MSQLSNRWLIALLCVNAVLVTAIICCHLGLPQAEAQISSRGNYLLVPGMYQSDEELLCIIDLAQGRMTTCLYNKNRERIDFGDVLDMAAASRAFEQADVGRRR